MNVKIAICAECNKAFTIKKGRKLVCNVICRNRYLAKKYPPPLKENVGYESLHRWVRKRLTRPSACENCKTAEPYDLANKGIYDRELKNWKWLCRRCHMLEDGRLVSLLNKIKERSLPMRIINCKYCKKEFSTKNRVFCSKNCSGSFNNFKRHGNKEMIHKKKKCPDHEREI